MIEHKKQKKLLVKYLADHNIGSRENLEKTKRRFAKEFGTSFPSNVDLLKIYHRLVKNKTIRKSKIIENLLITRPIRSLSGIVNISVLTKPYPCPGQCIYCPTEKGFPKSYVSGEPAADRAKALGFDPYLQVQKRLESLNYQGHPIDKIELRIVGGTWSFYPKQYQTWFIKRCFQAANEFKIGHVKTKRVPNKKGLVLLGKVQKKNETARNRIVGLSIETRPDFIDRKEVLRLRKLGVTLVELGVQTVFDDILKKCRTGMAVQKISQATQILKNAGFKVLYQIMPNLPGSNLSRDLECFQILFNDARFRPDWLKIYPCVVCPKTKLLNVWKGGGYKPYSCKQLVKLLITIKTHLPYWVRVARIFRDIPSYSIIAGCRASNLREVVALELKKQNKRCHCIRCREVRARYCPQEKINLFREDYEASGGKEIFLSFENKERTKLFSLLRLRIQCENTSRTAIIREIQTFGPQLSLKTNHRGQDSMISPQHKGLGKQLIKSAESIAKDEFGLKKISVIAGIGVRDYYRKLGYRLKNTYMVKNL